MSLRSISGFVQTGPPAREMYITKMSANQKSDSDLPTSCHNVFYFCLCRLCRNATL